MNTKVKALWVEALRSGKYQKGRGSLKRIVDGKAEYCCLGVLCELSPIESKVAFNADHVENFAWNDYGSYLPPEVCEWADLSNSNPRVQWKGDVATLADVNDNSDATFEDIANLIEEHL